MPIVHLIPLSVSYLVWHYSFGLLDFFYVLRNLLWFVGHFFSIPLMLRTLLSPWKRMDEGYPKGLDLNKVGEALIVNTLMRLVGVFIRLLAVVMGFVSALIILALGLIALAVWVVFPVLIPALIFIGGLWFVSGEFIFI